MEVRARGSSGSGMGTLASKIVFYRKYFGSIKHSSL